MAGPSMCQRLIFSTSMLAGAVVGYGRRAHAACVPVGGSNFECSGASTAQSISAANANVFTLPGFSITTVSANGLTISGSGDLAYTDTNSSPITATSGNGLNVSNSAGPGSITINTNGAVIARNYGIRGRNTGSGALSITANGDITSTGTGVASLSRGIVASNFGTDLTVTTGSGASVVGLRYGVLARNYGSGTTSVTVNGDVTASGTTGTDVGILARGTAGVSVTTAAGTAVVGQETGIFARSDNVGAVNISVSGDVTGNTASAIYARTAAGGLIAITVSQSGQVTANGAGFAIDTSALTPANGSTELIVAGSLNGGTGGAVRFHEGSALADRLELHPTASINGTVFAGPGTDTFALGGTGTGSLDLALIGAAAQYRGFEVFEKVGDSQWTLTGTNTELDVWTVKAGLLSVEGSMPDTDFDVDGGTLALTGSGSIVNSIVSLNGAAGTFDIAGTSAGATIESLSGVAGSSVALGGQVLTLSNASGTFGGTIRGTGGLTLIAGTETFTGANSYTGATTIEGGTLALTGTGSIAASSSVDLGSAGTFDIAATSAGATIVSLSGTAGSSVALGGQVLTLSNAGGTFGGTISGTGGLNLAAGTETLTGASSYTGATIVEGGTLALAGTGSIARSSGVNLGAAGTFDIAGTSAGATIESLSGVAGSSVALGDHVLTLSNASGTFGGTIGGTGGLTLAAGTQTLTGTNSYNGGTTIISGTLIGNVASIRGDIDNDGAVVFDQNADATFTGDIDGSGTILKNGGGVLTLAGQSRLDWSVAAGGLVSAAERFSGDVAIGAAASFTFDQPADASYGGTISGAGTLVKAGLGDLTLTGDSGLFSGTTTLAAGALAFNGILGGAMEILPGARLQGTGTVGTTTVASGATIAPGNSIGTLTVRGDIIFEAGSIYVVEIGEVGQNDLIDVAGAAMISGGTVEVVSIQGLALVTPYRILTAAGGLSGTFDGEAMAPLSIFLTPELSYDANNVYFSIAQTARFASAAQRPNQVAAAAAIDSLGVGNDVWNAVALLGTQAEAQAAFDSLSGEIHASIAGALIADSRFVRTAANDRLRPAFDSVAAPAAPTPVHEAGSSAPAASADGLAVWGQAFGSWGRRDGTGNAAGADRSIGGLFLGAAAPVGDHWQLGLIGGYSRTDFDVDERSSFADSEDLHLGIHGGAQYGKIGFRFGAAYSWHDIDVDRRVAFPGFNDSLDAAYHAETGQVFVDAGYRIETRSARFEPFANLAYVRTRMDGFTETGGEAALIASSSTQDAIFATLGTRIDVDLALGDQTARLRASLGWQHAFVDAIQAASVRLSGGSAFTVAGLPIARDVAVVEAGASLGLGRNASLAVSYSGQIGSGLEDHGIDVALSVRF